MDNGVGVRFADASEVKNYLENLQMDKKDIELIEKLDNETDPYVKKVREKLKKLVTQSKGTRAKV